MEKRPLRLLIAVLLILTIVISFTFAADKATDPETYAKTAASIDEKIDSVLKLTAASAIVSTVISAIPDDTATPLAEEVAEFADYFLIVLVVLYAEKFLLTVFGIAAFRVLIPAACILGMITLFRSSDGLRRLAWKFVLFALMIVFLIPSGMRVSGMITNSYSDSITAAINAAQEVPENTEDLTEQQSTDLLGRIAGAVGSLTDQAARVMNRFIEALAVMIVTSCIVPLVILLFFLWFIRLLTGVDLIRFVPARKGIAQAAARAVTESAEV